MVLGFCENLRKFPRLTILYRYTSHVSLSKLRTFLPSAFMRIGFVSSIMSSNTSRSLKSLAFHAIIHCSQQLYVQRLYLIGAE
jgi:hypothetical protein